LPWGFESDSGEKEKKGKGGRKGILQKVKSSRLAIAAIVLFILGLLLGIYIQDSLVGRPLAEKQEADYNALYNQNQQLDKVADGLYNCLIDSGIDPKTC
jgi:hypothetical protein